MGAGPVPEILHRVLNLFALAVRLRLLPSLLPLARLMHCAINIAALGRASRRHVRRDEGRGADGERVDRARGTCGRRRRRPVDSRRWRARRSSAIASPAAAGSRARGRRPATSNWKTTRQLFARRAIHTGTREVTPATRRCRSIAACSAKPTTALPAPLQAMHDLQRRDDRRRNRDGDARHADCSRGLRRRWSAFRARARTCRCASISRSSDGRERWTRTFAGRSFHSTQEQGRGRFEWLVCERFGPLYAGMALVLDDGKLRLIVRRWSVFGIPLPVVARAARRLIRIRRERPVSFSCRDRASVHRPDRRLSGMAGSARDDGGQCAIAVGTAYVRRQFRPSSHRRHGSVRS